LILGVRIGLPTVDPTWAAEIQLLLNTKLLRCNYFLQRRQGGAVYECNVYGRDWLSSLFLIWFCQCLSIQNLSFWRDLSLPLLSLIEEDFILNILKLENFSLWGWINRMWFSFSVLYLHQFFLLSKERRLKWANITGYMTYRNTDCCKNGPLLSGPLFPLALIVVIIIQVLDW